MPEDPPPLPTPPVLTAAHDSPQLEYSPSRRVRTRWRRLILLVFVAFVLIAVMPSMWTEFGYRVGRRELQRSFMTHTAPPGTLAYAEGADAGRISTSEWVDTRPDTLTMRGARQAPFWQSQWNTPGYWPNREATLFLHQRRSRNGTGRIVAVSVIAQFRRFNPEVGPDPVNFRLATAQIVPFHSSSRTVPQVWHGEAFQGHWPDPDRPLKFFLGQPDPRDASRFTIDYAVGDAPGTIEGRLLDDDTVTLTVKDGPLLDAAATRPVTPSPSGS